MSVSSSKPELPRRRVGIAGAGYIARFHLAALARLGHANVVAICDPDKGRAEGLQRQWGIPQAFESLDAMLESCALDVVHVLVPPALHVAVASRCLEAGAHVFVEKPLAVTGADARTLLDTSRRAARRIGVNHNLLFHPAFLQLVDAIREWWFGRVRHVIACWSVPLRQLQSGQLDHWMFAATGNIVLEQAVHPLSLIAFLLGRTCSTVVNATPPLELPTGARFIENWQVSLQCERGSATSMLSFNAGFPQSWLCAIGDDAVGHVDFRLNTFVMTRPSRFATPIDEVVQSARSGASVTRQSASNLCLRVMETLKWRPDPFARTIEASIGSFYQSLSSSEDTDGAAMAAHLIDVCEEIGRRPAQPVVLADAVASGG